MAVVSDYTALIGSNAERWNTMAPQGAPVVVTYSFMSDDELAGWPLDGDPVVLPGWLRDWVRLALDMFSATAGITFLEVDDGAMINVAGLSNTDGASYASGPHVTGGSPSDTVHAGINLDFYDRFKPGTGGFYAILHEIGHTLGLQHPHEGPRTLHSDYDSSDYTVMSYNRNWGYADEPQPFDVDALEYLYGAPDADGGTPFEVAWLPDEGRVQILGTNARETIIGVNGATVIEGRRGSDTIIGRDGDDRLEGQMGADTLNGNRGDDTLHGGSGRDMLMGGPQNDLLLGAKHADHLRGRAHADTLDGGLGDDRLQGEHGHDRLIGGPRNDTLTGGHGRDVFVFDSGVDRITDFEPDKDRIDVSATWIDSYDELMSVTRSTGNDTRIVVSDTDEISLKDIAPTDLSESDFIF